MQSHYDLIGGEPAVHRITERFYAHMDELPETYGIRKLHAEDLSGSQQKLFEFLSGWLGGPQLFVERHGNPMLRRRHLNFPINSDARDQWMLCMRLALDEVITDVALREHLYNAILKLADHMRNQQDPAATPSCPINHH
ncbi:MAG: globin [Betaproteobacteria bacterium]|nr:MAG: globin [Betaproteobacteria bacterium]